jgi:ubiquinone/menaquinone biosynthesis C-methylase UbiE
MLAVLEHLSDPAPVLREAYRILAPGGSLLMTYPHAVLDPLLKVLHKVGLISKEMECEKHERRIPLRELRELLEGIGFERCIHRKFEFGLNNLVLAHKPD